MVVGPIRLDVDLSTASPTGIISPLATTLCPFKLYYAAGGGGGNFFYSFALVNNGTIWLHLFSRSPTGVAFIMILPFILALFLVVAMAVSAILFFLIFNR